MKWLSSTYLKLNPILREHIAPACALISALAAILVGGVAIYTNKHSLELMSRQQEQMDDGQYQQYQGSVALAWRTVGEANGKRFEVGQSTSLYYLAQNNELSGYVTLNGSQLNLTAPKVKSLIQKANRIFFDLSKSALCGTEITKLHRSNPPTITFSYSLLRRAIFRGTFQSDDFLAADLQSSRFVDARLTNARFAGSDLRETFLVGGYFDNADFQGADLRTLVTVRGDVGVGSQDLGWYDFSSYYDDGPVDWPLLFDSQLGVNDMLAAVGRQAAPEGGKYLVDFSKSNFRNADLRGANLQDSNISQAQINQACTDANTKLPSGRSASRSCDRSYDFTEKLSSLRLPLQNNLLEKTCAAQ